MCDAGPSKMKKIKYLLSSPTYPRSRAGQNLAVTAAASSCTSPLHADEFPHPTVNPIANPAASTFPSPFPLWPCLQLAIFFCPPFLLALADARQSTLEAMSILLMLTVNSGGHAGRRVQSRSRRGTSHATLMLTVNSGGDIDSAMMKGLSRRRGGDGRRPAASQL
jgi:hypothetical protein